MARYAYNVNTTQRYIDVHKQFRGGLKTVDTDDSLGAVFLRQADNVSLSEFGFIEKRYGTFKKGVIPRSGKLQGYWKFLNYTIYAVAGTIYYNDGTGEQEVTRLFKEKDTLRYPTTVFTESSFTTCAFVAGEETLGNLTNQSTTQPACQSGASYISCTQNDQNTWDCTTYNAVITTHPFLVPNFQATREMGAVAIGDVFYMFTGTYPIYAKLNDDDELTFYIFSVDLPTNNELVVTGHNLLEFDYNDAYFSTTSTVGNNETLSLPANFDFKEDEVIKPLKQQVTPRIPFVKDEDNAVSDGAVGFKSSFKYISSLLAGKYDTNNEYYYEMDLISSGFRPSGTGATTLEFQTIDPKEVDFNTISNYNTSANLDLFVEPEVKISNKVQTGAALATALASKNYVVQAVNIPYTKLKCGFEIEVNKDFLLDNKDKKLYYSFLRKKDDLDGTEVRYTFDEMDLLLDIEARSNAGETLLNTETGVFNDTTFQQTTGGYPWKEKKAIFTPFKTDANGNNTYFDNSAAEVDTIEIKNKNYIIDIPNGIEFENIDGFKIEFYQIIITYDDANANFFSNVFWARNTLQTQAVSLSNATSFTFNDVFLRTGITTGIVFDNPSDYTGISVSDILVGGSSVNIVEDTNPDTASTWYAEDGYQFVVPPGFNGKQTIEIQFTNGITYSGDIKVVEAGESKIQYSSKVLTTFPSQVRYDADPGSASNIVIDTVTLKETVGFAQELPTNNNFFENTPFIATVKNLISGLYDFRFRMNLTKYELKDGFLAIVETNEFDFFFPEINITPEKLSDYEFFEDDDGNAKHPIWSCNQVIEHFNKLMVWGSQEMKNSLFYSFPDRPTYFPSYFYLDFGSDKNEPITAVTPYMNILVVQTEEKTFGLKGNSGIITAPAPYTPITINLTVGTIAPKSVRAVRNQLFFLSKQGVIALKSLYAVDENYNIDFVDRNIRNIVKQDKNAVGIQFDNQYWLNFPEESITLRWYTDKRAWVQDKYAGWTNFGGVFKYQNNNGLLEFITQPSQAIGDSNLGIYTIGVDYTLPTDLTKPISAKFETSFLNQNYPFHPKNYKESKLDFTIQNEYNLGRVSIFDSSNTDETGTLTIDSGNSITIDLASTQVLKKNHKYRADFYINPQTDSQGVTTYDNVVVPANGLQVEETASVVEGLTQLDTNGNKVIAYEFFINNNYEPSGSLTDIIFTITSTHSNLTGAYATIRDVTYDDNLSFSTYVISEDQTLNFDNSPGYDQATVDVDLDLTLKGRLGDWTFGESDFGKKVTAVKTIKLSGKGYNSKLYVEDLSRSKWTLEAIGITYKMKRARSR